MPPLAPKTGGIFGAMIKNLMSPPDRFYTDVQGNKHPVIIVGEFSAFDDETPPVTKDIDINDYLIDGVSEFQNAKQRLESVCVLQLSNSTKVGRLGTARCPLTKMELRMTTK